MRLEDNITEVKGIGEKTAATFSKVGVNCIADLIRYYPRSYKIYEQPVSVNSISEGDRAAVFCKIVSGVAVSRGRRFTIVTLSAADDTGSIKMLWFNMPFLRNVLHKGESYVFVGSIKIVGSSRVMEMPEYYTQFNYQKMLSTMQPVYPLISGLTNNMVTKALKEVSWLIDSLPDWLNDDIRREYNVIGLGEALKRVHFPKNREELGEAIERLAFDEFLHFIIDVSKIKENNIKLINGHKVSEEALSRMAGFEAGLGFKLTEGQKAAVDDIAADMSSDHVMNRLIQGDVGSGKTVVAAEALYLAAVSGYQGAMMVPTEVLAEQHFNELTKLFKPYKLKVGLLTGSLAAKDRRLIYERLKNGEIDIVVGTHALITEKVEYKNLGLVITDEQHRFGVKQREKLGLKGDMPHVLIMSATPIPRTLAIILYADMDISVIKELPAGRKRIKNCVVGTDYRPSAYKFIRNEVANGHQAYVICPMVEESESVDAENVVNYADELAAALGSSVRVKYLHGRMKEQEKLEVMNSFLNHETDVLVSTTVIEVGINNPNATVMMIENAERFGLAQLHQLRGRVGRGDAQSYCIFINVKKSDESVKRLKVLEDSNDGFYIAAEDLKLRGPGEFFGIRQSGDIAFRVADIYSHADILRRAQEAAIKYGGLLGNEQ
ncbi:MAG: ATP-dependent DNA helicase RecG [Eubacterium sp.]|nr:ATP-dependent DNA helicase RecG [Eubacterium sp.]